MCGHLSLPAIDSKRSLRMMQVKGKVGIWWNFLWRVCFQDKIMDEWRWEIYVTPIVTRGCGLCGPVACEAFKRYNSSPLFFQSAPVT